MSHVVALNFSNTETYECGAALLALLAYPTSTEDEAKHADLHASLCAFALRNLFEEGTEGLNQPQRIKPVYAFRTQSQIDRDLRTVDRRLRDRTIAARMATGFIQEVGLGTVPKLPPGVKRLSINEMAKLVQDDAGYSDAGNVETRIWRESLPVVHLAAAMSVVMNNEIGEDAIHLLELMLDRAALEKIIVEAERYEGMLSQSRLKLDSGKLVKVRLA